MIQCTSGRDHPEDHDNQEAREAQLKREDDAITEAVERWQAEKDLARSISEALGRDPSEAGGHRLARAIVGGGK
jgi:hypothetical protein